MSRFLRSALTAIALAGICASGGCDWPWKHDMVDQRSLQTATSPRPPIAGTVPLQGELPITRDRAERELQNPIPGKGANGTGHTLYNEYCSPCHGMSGIGNGAVTKYFVPPGDLTSAAVQGHSDGWIYATITNGTEHMPRQGTELTPDERWQIVNFVRTFGAVPR